MSEFRRRLLFAKFNDGDMSEFRFINGVTLTEEAEAITINLDTDGKEFDLKDYYIEACIVNKNADNTDLTGWKIARLNGGGYHGWWYAGIDNVGSSLPAINQSLYIWCYGLYLGNDGTKDCCKVETYTGPYSNGIGATLLTPKIFKSKFSRKSIELTTACAGWKLGVGSFLNVYGRE